MRCICLVKLISTQMTITSNCSNIFQRLMKCRKISSSSYMYFHESCPLKKAKKERHIIQFKPKSKQPVIELWKGVTPLEIADVIKRDIDDVFQAISYVENSELYEDPDTEITDLNVISAIVKRLGCRVQFVRAPETEKEIVVKNKDVTKRPPPDLKDLVKRPPVVAIMGHVDHGKTTLLDALRHSSIVSQEFGGITQHIGAFTVNLPKGKITFLDTPGHAAFKTMRARGAHATDLVVLVVAADDGIMEQTVESVKFAKEANVPIIVAINKIDKPSKDIEKIKQDLLGCGLQIEELGGEVQTIPISALKKINLDLLTEAILTQAEMMGVAGDPTGLAEGVVLEASLDTTKGKVSTALIQRGTLKKGSIIVAGTSWAKVRNIYDEYGKVMKEATPGLPAQIYGWKSFPVASETILEVKSEKQAREVVHFRENKQKEEKMMLEQSIIKKKADAHTEKYREERMARLMRGRYRKERNYFREKETIEDTFPTVAFVLKGDVHGSVEAIMDVINTYDYQDDCRLEVLQNGVGAVSENDLEMAEAFDGFIYTFNVTVPPEVKKLAAEKDIKIKPFNVIYHLINDVKFEINSRLPLTEVEDIIGEATVLQEFVINEGKKKLPVAGCKCVKGVLKKGLCKIVRSDDVIYRGPITSLKHQKTSVESIKKDVECGLMVEDAEVTFLPGDSIVCFSVRTVAQMTKWNPGF